MNFYLLNQTGEIVFKTDDKNDAYQYQTRVEPNTRLIDSIKLASEFKPALLAEFEAIQSVYPFYTWIDSRSELSGEPCYSIRTKSGGYVGYLYGISAGYKADHNKALFADMVNDARAYQKLDTRLKIEQSIARKFIRLAKKAGYVNFDAYDGASRLSNDVKRITERGLIDWAYQCDAGSITALNGKGDRLTAYFVGGNGTDALSDLGYNESNPDRAEIEQLLFEYSDALVEKYFALL